jgi:hypothetical protein
LPPKTLRKSALKALLILLLVTLVLAIPEVAHAWTAPTAPTDPLNLCAGDVGTNPDYTGFTRRIVLCIQNTVLAAVTTALLSTLFEVFYPILGACMTLAVAFWGIQMATGQRGWTARQGFGLAFKVALLTIVFGYGTVGYNFVYLYNAALTFMSEILGAVTGYISFSQAVSCDFPAPSAQNAALVVWDHVDCALNTLIGGLIDDPTSNVAVGIGGFVLAALLSGGPGIFVALLGLLVVVQVLFAIIRALYIYILAYISFSLMALVAPIFLPMILFRSTQGYFEKWLKLSIGFILQPIFLFVYLAMLLAAYDTVVYTGEKSLFNVITGGGYYDGCKPTICTAVCGANSCPAIGPWLSTATGMDGKPVYTPKKSGSLSVSTNPGFANGKPPTTCPLPPATCGGPTVIKTETGIGGDQAEVPTPASAWPTTATASIQSSVYQSLQIDDYFFHINVPVTVVDWDALASASSMSAPSEGVTQKFLANLFMSLFMAVATTYIFLLLLDMLPFIGSGVANIGSFISGGSGMSGFGFGGLAPPGAGMINNLRKKIAG